MTLRVPEGPPPAPPVQRLRVRYAKRGRLRFTSARDFQRALERALRRAEIPVAYSAGFHPHPRVSYAGAVPTGVASEAEYFEIALSQRRDPEQVRRLLDQALPAGLDVLQVVDASGGPLADRLAASLWRIDLPGVDAEELRAALASLLESERVEVSRMMRSGPRTFDVREALVSGRADPGDEGEPTPERGQPCAILHLVVRHTTPVVRPDDVLTALRVTADFVAPVPPLVTRLAQGPLQTATATVTDPLSVTE